MRTQTDRNLDLRDGAIIRLKDAYKTAKLIGETHADLLQAVNRAKRDITKCPTWVKAYVDGYDKALSDELYRTALVHGGWFNGRFYSTVSSRDDYYNSPENGIEPAHFTTANNTGHYWKPENHKGDAKPFFTAATRSKETAL